MSLNKKILKNMLIKMYHTRKFEETAAQLFAKGGVHGTTHLYVGQEATAAGVCLALNNADMITSTHRGHGHCISRGIDINSMMAEFLGKETGCCKGRGGSMHIADIANGNLGENGVVGGGCGIATGAAIALKKKGSGIVACFFGDGASNEGSFHEAANLASVWKLPVLFVCENNQYGMSMHISRSMNIDNIADRACAYGFPSKTVDGNDVIAVYQAAKQAREYVANNGPMMLVCDTYRISGHSKSDTGVYRTEREISEWHAKDPIIRMRAYMLDNGFTNNELDSIDTQTSLDIENALRFAQNSPDPSVDTILDGVYA
ncbi:MAG: thiamine pyrophosphate-dependent dehydrogenase E1 component subunit alpha [Christensenellales bacterium]